MWSCAGTVSAASDQGGPGSGSLQPLDYLRWEPSKGSAESMLQRRAGRVLWERGTGATGSIAFLHSSVVCPGVASPARQLRSGPPMLSSIPWAILSKSGAQHHLSGLSLRVTHAWIHFALHPWCLYQDILSIILVDPVESFVSASLWNGPGWSMNGQLCPIRSGELDILQEDDKGQ